MDIHTTINEAHNVVVVIRNGDGEHEAVLTFDLDDARKFATILNDASYAAAMLKMADSSQNSSSRCAQKGEG